MKLLSRKPEYVAGALGLLGVATLVALVVIAWMR